MKKIKKYMLIIFSIVIFSSISYQNVFAFDNGLFWEFSSYFLDFAPAGSGDTVRFEIFDPALSLNGGPFDQLAVTVESKDSMGSTIETFNLILSETADNGIFGVDHILLMEEEAEVRLGDVVLITIADPCDEPSDTDGNCDPNTIETLSGTSGESVIVYSDSTGVGGFIAIDLIETGPDTGIFTRQLRFTTGSSSAVNAVLQVSLGDVFTIEDQKTGSLTNGLIKGDPSRFAILVEVGGSVEVTATETGSSTPITHSTDIIAGTPGGRGSGGLVNPGLVVDSSSRGGGGCDNCQPPTLGLDKNYNRIVYEGFSYNYNPTNVELFYTPYPLISVEVGQQNVVILKIFDDGGIDKIQHVSLAFGLGNGQSFSESKATISLDIAPDGTEKTSIYDPENVLDDVKITTSIDPCNPSGTIQCLIVTIHHMFREELLFNMVATNVWDYKKNSWQNFYNHGIEIVGESMNPPKTKLVAFGSKEMRGLFELTQIDKKEDIWVDEFGNTYKHKGNDRFDKIPITPKRIAYDDLTQHGCGRNCNWFSEQKLNQELLAQITFKELLNGNKIHNELPKETFSYTYNILQRWEDPILQQSIKQEIEKAEYLYEHFFATR